MKDCKIGECIICKDIIETVKNKISGFYEPILCIKCEKEMIKYLNKK
jgi:uncharacterized protein YlzI (FlbEa/FlbD family)